MFLLSYRQHLAPTLFRREHLVGVLSPHSYVIELDDGTQRHVYANRLKRYIVCAVYLTCHQDPEVLGNCAVVSDSDKDFGDIETFEHNELVFLPMGARI